MSTVPHEITVPLGVAPEHRKTYIKNFNTITLGSGKLFLFAGDQKIEHLNKDFHGEGVDPQDAHPRHLFEIAANANIGAFATQYGLISRYGAEYKDIPYIVKINSKTNLVPVEQDDPWNAQLVAFEDILRLRDEHDMHITGIGFTLYLGSEYEHAMMEQAGELIAKAQYYGLISIIWAYPRGEAVPKEKDPHIIAGAAGVATALGADFVKVNLPESEHPFEDLKEAIDAAGNTGVITAGGGAKPPHDLLKEIYMINRAGAAGNAVGRNIHQRSKEDALALCRAIAAIVYHGVTHEEAVKLYEGNNHESEPS